MSEPRVSGLKPRKCPSSPLFSHLRLLMVVITMTLSSFSVRSIRRLAAVVQRRYKPASFPKMSFHFGTKEYTFCFLDLPQPDTHLLRTNALQYLDSFDPQLWYDDPVSPRTLLSVLIYSRSHTCCDEASDTLTLHILHRVTIHSPYRLSPYSMGKNFVRTMALAPKKLSIPKMR